MQEDSRTSIGRYLGLDQKEMVRNSDVQAERRMGSCHWGHDDQLQWKWTSRIPWIQCSGTRSFEKQRKRKLSSHFCGDDETAAVVLRTITSVNQLSVYGAVTDMCDELAWRISGCSESTGNLCAQNNSETMVMPIELSTTNNTRRTNETVQGNLLRDYERKFANLPDHLH